MGPFAGFSPSDAEILAKTIWGEARGQTLEAKVAVGWVVRNRAEKVLAGKGQREFGNGSITGAAKAPWQFSCWNSNSPEAQGMALAGQLPDPSWADCQVAAGKVLLGTAPDPTGGALWYYSEGIPRPEGWGSPDFTLPPFFFYTKLGGA